MEKGHGSSIFWFYILPISSMQEYSNVVICPKTGARNYYIYEGLETDRETFISGRTAAVDGGLVGWINQVLVAPSPQSKAGLS